MSMNRQEVVTPGAGAAIKHADGTELSVRGETSGDVLAAQARAMVQAQVWLAKQHPRDLDVVRTRVLKDCSRPRFADAAIYSLPRGKKNIEGPSVRLAEALFQHMENMTVTAQTIYEDREKRKVLVTAMDLERNVTTSQEVIISKTVERRDSKDREVLGERVNSYGEVVYIVAATDDELLMKTNATVSKLRRNVVLQLVPADIKEEAIEKANATLSAEIQADPDAARKRIIDSFAKVGVDPVQLKTYVGKPVEQFLPKDMEELRKLYAGITSGEVIWREAMEAKVGAAAPIAEAVAARVITAAASADPDLVERLFIRMDEAAAAKDMAALNAAYTDAQKLPKAEQEKISQAYIAHRKTIGGKR